MGEFNFGAFAQVLAETSGNGVTFEGQAKNWGSENEGLFCFV